MSNRWRRTKINKKIRSWQELIQELPQGFVLGPLLVNINLDDLFYLADSNDVCNLPDNKIFKACDKDLNSLINKLGYDS